MAGCTLSGRSLAGNLEFDVFFCKFSYRQAISREHPRLISSWQDVGRAQLLFAVFGRTLAEHFSILRIFQVDTFPNGKTSAGNIFNYFFFNTRGPYWQDVDREKSETKIFSLGTQDVRTQGEKQRYPSVHPICSDSDCTYLEGRLWVKSGHFDFFFQLEILPSGRTQAGKDECLQVKVFLQTPRPKKKKQKTKTMKP